VGVTARGQACTAPTRLKKYFVYVKMEWWSVRIRSKVVTAMVQRFTVTMKHRSRPVTVRTEMLIASKSKLRCPYDTQSTFEVKSLFTLVFVFRVSELSQQEESGKPWGEVIVASLIVNIVTLIGVLFIAGDWLRTLFCPGYMSGSEQHILWTRLLIPMFACGALLATTFFLVLPEGLSLIQEHFAGSEEGHDHRRHLQEEHESNETAASWRFGASILGGFLIPIVGHIILSHEEEELITHSLDEPKHVAENIASVEPNAAEGNNDSNDINSCSTSEGQSPEKECADTLDVVKTESKQSRNRKETGWMRISNPELAASLVLADFFHNFVDGVFLGTSFLVCERSLAISIAAATIFHELAQESADYFMFVHHCGMSPVGALTLNFVCGLSVMLGGVLVLVFDMTSVSIGTILCIGGGVYVHVSVAECLTTAMRHEKGRKHKVYGILAFVTGAVPIGLVLLNHVHCGTLH